MITLLFYLAIGFAAYLAIMVVLGTAQAAVDALTPKRKPQPSGEADWVRRLRK